MLAVTITQINPQELEEIIEKCVRKVLNENKEDKKIADEFMTVEEVADFLKLEKCSMYTLVSQKKIPFMKRGKRLYFSRDQITQWLYENKIN